jgi:PAS domain S-box-containing protein
LRRILPNIFNNPTFGWAVVLITFVLSSLAWFVSSRLIEEKAETRFQFRVKEIESSIKKQMFDYKQILSSAEAFYTVSNNISREQWEAYTSKLMLQENFPAIQGLGVTLKILPNELYEHEQKIRSEGFPNYAVWPDYERDEYFSIIYLEPFNDKNLKAFGYDMYSEPVRREAMNRARNSGLPAISYKVKLIQSNEEEFYPGLLLYYPIYENGDVPETKIERKAKLKGFIYSPFWMNELIKGIFKQGPEDLGFVIYDGDANPENILYNSSEIKQKEKPSFRKMSNIYIYGKKWTIDFYSLPNFINNQEKSQPLLIGIMGLVINILICLVFLSLSISNHKMRKLTEDLHKEKERYELVSIATNDIIWDWNLETNKITWNKNFVKMFGFPSDQAELTIDSWYNRIHPDDQKRIIKGIYKVIESHEGQWVDEYRFKKIDGKYISIFDRGYVLRNRNYKPYRMVGCMADITDRKEQENQKDAFLGIASHELKTPITSLKAYLQVIEKQLLEKNYQELEVYIAKTNKHINKLTELISDLLDVSKIQAGKLKLNLSEFNLTELIKDCTGQMQHISVKHQFIIHKEDDFKINGDVARIEQVISNFLSNAVKYSPESDKVVIDINKEDRNIRVSVTDYGVGIPKEKLSKIFTRFYRVEESASKFPGLGLGLHIAAEIVKRHKGEVGVESELGKGSVFYFTIPV